MKGITHRLEGQHSTDLRQLLLFSVYPRGQEMQRDVPTEMLLEQTLDGMVGFVMFKYWIQVSSVCSYNVQPGITLCMLYRL